MKSDEYATAQHQLITLCLFARFLPAEEMLRAQERADTVGPVMDPTLYRDAIQDPQERWRMIKRLTQAAAKFKAELEEVMPAHLPLTPR